MRPQRFMDFAVETYRAAGLTAEPWQDGTARPYGVRVRLPGGREIHHAVVSRSPEGEDYNQPEQPTEGAAPAAVTLPDLGTNPTPAQAEQYLTAVLINSGSREIAGAYGYSDRETPARYPGIGIEFHSGGRAYCMFRS